MVATELRGSPGEGKWALTLELLLTKAFPEGKHHYCYQTGGMLRRSGFSSGQLKKHPNQAEIKRGKKVNGSSTEGGTRRKHLPAPVSLLGREGSPGIPWEPCKVCTLSGTISLH